MLFESFKIFYRNWRLKRALCSIPGVYTRGSNVYYADNGRPIGFITGADGEYRSVVPRFVGTGEGEADIVLQCRYASERKLAGWQGNGKKEKGREK